VKDTDYLSISARIRAMETRLLDKERRDRMIDARSDEEALKLLGECGYAEPENAGAGAVDAVLSRAREELFADLKKSVPEPALVEVFQIKYDYHNAKAVLKANALGEDGKHLLMRGGRYDPAGLAAQIAKGEPGETGEVFQAAVRTARDALSQTHDPQRADMALDRACYEEMGQAAKKSGSAFLQGYVRLCVDAANLRTAVRCARMGVERARAGEAMLPGGNVDARELAGCKASELEQCFRNSPLAQAAQAGSALCAAGSGRLTEFERLCDNAVNAYLATARRVPFGEQPVVGYLCAREAEATTVRTILALRSAGLSGEAIRERLRDSYV